MGEEREFERVTKNLFCGNYVLQPESTHGSGFQTLSKLAWHHWDSFSSPRNFPLTCSVSLAPFESISC